MRGRVRPVRARYAATSRCCSARVQRSSRPSSSAVRVAAGGALVPGLVEQVNPAYQDVGHRPGELLPGGVEHLGGHGRVVGLQPVREPGLASHQVEDAGGLGAVVPQHMLHGGHVDPGIDAQGADRGEAGRLTPGEGLEFGARVSTATRPGPRG